MTAPMPAPSDRRAARVLAFLAAALVVYGLGIAAVTVWRERAFFSAHTVQKTQLLRLPPEIARAELQLKQEQAGLIAVQNAIRSR